MNTSKAEMRSYIFYHLDGIALVPTIIALGKKVLKEINGKK